MKKQLGLILIVVACLGAFYLLFAGDWLLAVKDGIDFDTRNSLRLLRGLAYLSLLNWSFFGRLALPC
ncbi:TPA: hypothetical protein TXL57_000126 [Streptococcus suis]|nr:hypothetical protein [Streptococcus suis]